MQLTNPSYIKDILERHSFSFSKTFGQNFLITASIPERIADSAALNESTTVLEIGPGIGCLTRELSQRAGKVITVEIDTRLLPILNETLDGLDNVRIVNADVLEVDLSELLGGENDLAVCANLPYNITTPILVRLFESGLTFRTVTVMVQKEVAQRFCAEKGSKDYGAITLFLNYYAKPKILFPVGAGNFMPRPRVDSAVLQLQAIEPPVDTDPKKLFRLIRAAFSMRRKTLQNNLASIGIPKEDTARALTEMGLSPSARGEELDLREYAALADRLANLTKSKRCPKTLDT